MSDNNEAFMALESYCEYLTGVIESPFPCVNNYTIERHIREFNQLRTAVGMESISSITLESIKSTLSVVGSGLVKAGKIGATVGEVILSGIVSAHALIVDLTANADDINKKSQVVLRNAKRFGVKEDDNLITVNGSKLQYNNKLTVKDIIVGLHEAKARLPIYVEWAKEHYTLAMEHSKFLPTHEKKFASFNLPGDKVVSISDHQISLHDRKDKLKTDTKLTPATISEIEEISELVHSLAGTIRSTGLDTLLGKVKDYVKRTNDNKETVVKYNTVFNPTAITALVSVVNHLLDSCVAALVYCEKSTLS